MKIFIQSLNVDVFELQLSFLVERLARSGNVGICLIHNFMLI